MLPWKIFGTRYGTKMKNLSDQEQNYAQGWIAM